MFSGVFKMTKTQKDTTLSVLASSCCCNKLLQMYWLKTAQMYYYLIVPQLRSSKRVSLGWHQGVSRTALLLEALGKNLFSCLSQLLEAVCMPWLMAPSSIFKSQQHRILDSLSASASPASLSLKKGSWWHWTHWINQDNLSIWRSVHQQL